jgi:hypothetical protein
MARPDPVGGEPGSGAFAFGAGTAGKLVEGSELAADVAGHGSPVVWCGAVTSYRLRHMTRVFKCRRSMDHGLRSLSCSVGLAHLPWSISRCSLAAARVGSQPTNAWQRSHSSGCTGSPCGDASVAPTRAMQPPCRRQQARRVSMPGGGRDKCASGLRRRASSL